MLNKLSMAFVGVTLAATFTFSAAVNAHSPEMHKKKNAEKPNCEAMNNMDHSKMDMNDPVMQAMMTQCMGSKNNNEEHKGMNMNHENMNENNEHNNDDGHHGATKKPQ